MSLSTESIELFMSLNMKKYGQLMIIPTLYEWLTEFSEPYNLTTFRNLVAFHVAVYIGLLFISLFSSMWIIVGVLFLETAIAVLLLWYHGYENGRMPHTLLFDIGPYNIRWCWRMHRYKCDVKVQANNKEMNAFLEHLNDNDWFVTSPLHFEYEHMPFDIFFRNEEDAIQYKMRFC